MAATYHMPKTYVINVKPKKIAHAKPIDLLHLSPNCHRFSTISVAKGQNDRVHNNVFISGIYGILRNS